MLKGDKVCFITSAEDADTVNKQHNVFPRHPFIRHVVTAFGVTKDGLRLLWGQPKRNNLTKEAHRHATVIENVLGFAHQKLSPSAANMSIHRRFVEQVIAHTGVESIPKAAILSEQPDGKFEVSLATWIRQAFGHASTRAIFGESLFRIEPDILQYVLAFDDKSWMLFSDIPPPWSSSMWKAKKKVQEAVTEFFNLPEGERSDASEMLKSMESSMRENNVCTDDIATFITLVYSA